MISFLKVKFLENIFLKVKMLWNRCFEWRFFLWKWKYLVTFCSGEMFWMRKNILWGWKCFAKMCFEWRKTLWKWKYLVTSGKSLPSPAQLLRIGFDRAFLVSTILFTSSICDVIKNCNFLKLTSYSWIMLTFYPHLIWKCQ